MADGGFKVKIGKKTIYCYAITLDYDKRTYAINDGKKRRLPLVKKITIETVKD